MLYSTCALFLFTSAAVSTSQQQRTVIEEAVLKAIVQPTVIIQVPASTLL